jgi:5-hydroxyisourate hydrolase
MLKPIRASTLAGLLSLVGHSHFALATDNPLSVYILDLQNGQPTSGVTVDLERKTAKGWYPLSSAVTDAQGRIRELFPPKEIFAAGEYRVVFHTGEHYAKFKQPTYDGQVAL